MVYGKLDAKWAQIPANLNANRGMQVSKGSRINASFADCWRGRWESNRTPRLDRLIEAVCVV
jgi:hypothetical protein